MNFTLDDSSAQLSYSPRSWAVQSAADPERTEFFQSTYHAAESDGASVNMSIAGSAFYLYGSKDLGIVQYDGAIIYLSAYAEETAYQQLLFSHAFDPSSSSPHFVSLTAHLAGAGVNRSWLDFDYVTFTSPTTSPSSGTASSTDGADTIALPTAIPPWQSESDQPTTTGSGLSPLASPTGASSSSQQKSSKVPTILAALFGSIIALVLLGLLVYYVLRRAYDSQRAQEHSFRFGQSSVGVSSVPGMQSQSRFVPLNGSTALLNANPGTGTTNANDSSSGNGKANNTHAVTPPSSPGFGSMTSGSATGEERDGKTTVTMSTGTSGSGSAEMITSPVSSTPFAFLSSAPITKFQFARRNKGDADSLRTDFLQV